MNEEDIAIRHKLIQDIRRLKQHAATNVFYDSSYSGSRGLIDRRGKSVYSDVPSLVGDIEAVVKRAIERELKAAISQAKKLDIELAEGG